MSREKIDTWLEWAILGVVLVILVLSALAFGATRAIDFSIVEALTVVAVVLWAVRLAVAPQPKLLWPPACWAVLAFMIYTVVRYRSADVEYLARQEMLRVLVYGLLFFVVLNNLFRRDHTKLISLVLIFMGMAIAFYGLCQFGTGSMTVWGYEKPSNYLGRASGTFICPDHYAGYLLAILPLALVYTASSKFGYGLRICVGYAAMLMLGGIVVSFSRGAWLACLVVLAGLILVVAQDRKLRLSLLVVLLLGTATVYGFMQYSGRMVQRRIEQAMQIGNRSENRLMIWPAAVKIWKTEPLWGVGPAQFDTHFPAFRPAARAMQSRPVYVHNDWLNVLVDYGLAGLAIVGAFWALLGGYTVYVWRRLAGSGGFTALGSTRLVFALGCSISLAAVLAHVLVDFDFHVPANALLAVVLMALLAAHVRFATDNFWVAPGKFGRVLGTASLLGIAFYLGAAGLRTRAEASWIAKGDTARTISERIACYQRALLVEPANYGMHFQLGEVHRQISWEANAGWEEHATEAMKCFARCMDLNPRFGWAPVRYGMCLHWLKRSDEAAPFFERAVRLDPNLAMMRAFMGWHLFNDARYPEAIYWLISSFNIDPENNSIAKTYLPIAQERVAESHISGR